MIRMKRIVFFLIILIGLASCATMLSSNPEDVNEKLKAENKIMKKKLSGLERENSKFTEENEDYRKDLASQTARMEKLGQEMEVLTDKYQRDVHQLKRQIEDLEERRAAQELACSQQIQELTRLNGEMEANWQAERTQWNDELAAQREAFHREREVMQSESARREQELARQMEDLKKEIQALKEKLGSAEQQIEQFKKDAAGKEQALLSQQASGSELSLKIEEAAKEIQARDTKIQQLEKDIQDLKAKLSPLESSKPEAVQGATQ